MDLSPTTFPSGTFPNTTKVTSSSNANINQEINQNYRECVFLIVGGGIAGVSCAETVNFLAPEDKVILLSESALIKSVANLVQLGKYVQRFDVKVIQPEEIEKPNLNVVTDQLKSIASKAKIVETLNGTQIKYQFLCLCTGAKPELISTDFKEYVLGIRDTDSAKEFQSRLKSARKMVLVGNGGIASEVAYETRNIDIDWVIKDDHISSTFIDSAAAKFFEASLHNKGSSKKEETVIKRMRYMEKSSTECQQKGAALGPDWHRLVDLTGNSTSNSENIKIHYGVEVKRVIKSHDEFPIAVELTDGKILPTDFIVSATGVHPFTNFECDAKFKVGPDGGIFVDELMKTSLDSIFAAGDVCFAGWEHSSFWQPMKLWTQARQMGMMAAKSMVATNVGDEIYQDFCFELFTHVTTLFGFPVALLGKFNGQGLSNDYELMFRITPGKEFIKLVLKEGRLVGAILIGETGLEETFENLILNQMDLSSFGTDILNPNIDIEDFFD